MRIDANIKSVRGKKMYIYYIRWPEQNRLPENLLHRRCQESNLLLRRSLERALQSPPVSRNPTDSNPEQLPLEKSENIKSQLISSSESFPSKDSSEKLLTSSSRNLDSRALPCSLFKRLLRLTSSPSSKTPTCAPFTPRESPS